MCLQCWVPPYPPSSLPSSFPSRYRPTNTKEPNKNKKDTLRTTFRNHLCYVDFILVIHVEAMICRLLILFITQSASCTVRLPCLLHCCFPSHGWQISLDIASLPLSSTARKTKTSKWLAWRLSKSVCSSCNKRYQGYTWWIWCFCFSYVMVIPRVTASAVWSIKNGECECSCSLLFCVFAPTPLADYCRTFVTAEIYWSQVGTANVPMYVVSRK